MSEQKERKKIIPPQREKITANGEHKQTVAPNLHFQVKQQWLGKTLGINLYYKKHRVKIEVLFFPPHPD